MQHEGDFGTRNALYLDLGGGHTGTHLDKDSSSCMCT